jgi:hypothetical protein
MRWPEPNLGSGTKEKEKGGRGEE